MNRHAQEAQKEIRTNMTNSVANTAAAVAKRGAQGAPGRASLKKGASRKKGATRGRNATKVGKAKGAGSKTEVQPGEKLVPAKEARTPHEGSKKAKVLSLLGRKEGATLAQLMKATGWQAHSVRGFLSGALGKKMGLKIESQKQEDGERTYRLAK